MGGEDLKDVFFGVGSLIGNCRLCDMTLFEKVTDGEGMSRPQKLTPQMMKTVRKLAITEARQQNMRHDKCPNRGNEKDTN